MKKVWRGIRLLGRWEDVTIQGTSRTYQIYAYHPLDRLMSLGVILFLWTVLFFFAFCRSPGPNSMGVWMWGCRVLYVPLDPGPFLRLFLAWTAVPTVLFAFRHIPEHRRQRRILAGELTARRGTLAKIGCSQYVSRGGITRYYRFLLKVQEPGGRLVREVYDMPEALYQEYKAQYAPRACQVELALLAPKGEKGRLFFGDTLPAGLSDVSTPQLRMRVEHIFYLQALAVRCELEEDFLFTQEKTPTGGGETGRKKDKTSPKKGKPAK